ncbi:hypothetical protein C0989_007075 [Termitomyces sp. Mn162]|nr:hypothetical protein C0989_007075 [Termitomyces sp. Mn162]
MELLAPPWQLYLPLLTVVHLLNASSSLSNVLGPPIATSASKGKRKATVLSPSILAQKGNTSSLTAWKTVKQHFSAKEKDKGKAKEPEPSTTADKQIPHLLWCLHDARVPEDIGSDVVKKSVMQLALSQILNKLDVVCNQMDEAQLDLFRSALGKGKHVASPPQIPEAKKACTKPSVFVKGSSAQRVPLAPYDNQVPAGEDWLMNMCPDFGVPQSTADVRGYPIPPLFCSPS